MTDHLDVWHFASDTLRDGSPLPEKGWISGVIVPVEPCVQGWHGSVMPLGALGYAPGLMVARRRLIGTIKEHGDPADKHAASQCVALTGYVDATDTVHSFARWAALEVIDLWDAPRVVIEYLETGDEGKWDAAYVAAYAAAGDAARAAARATWAARAAAGDAGWAAARATWAAMAAAGGAGAPAWAAHNAKLEEMLTDLLEPVGHEDMPDPRERDYD